MSVATLTPPTAPVPATPHRAGEVDNRATYLSFGLAYVLGHGVTAVSKGADPLLDLPGWLPLTVLGTGLVVGSVFSTIAATRAQRGASRSDVLSGKLLGIAWVSGFVALFLAITGLAATLGLPDLPSVLWPTGSGLVVGLLYLGEGAARRNLLHYGLGTWLVLISTAALFFDAPSLYWILAVAGGGAYLVAGVLERGRLAAAWN